MEKKMTYAVAIDKAIKGELTNEVIARLEDLKVSLAKRNAKGKETKKQTENKGIKTEIVEVLANANKPMTATQIMNSLNGVYTIQKVSALLKSLVDSDIVIKNIEKKVSLFSIPNSTEEVEE